MGVCLFFSLSAYLITDLLLNEREKCAGLSVRKFYMRRALRIWPLYFLAIGIGMVLALLLHHKNDITGFVFFLLFTGNFYCAAFGFLRNPMMILWSISIEEQFYLLWPWAMRWFSRRGLLMCALSFIAIANVTLFTFGERHVNTGTVVWANTFVQFEMFATGILLALAKKRLVWSNPLIGSMLAISGPVLWFVSCFVFRAKPSGDEAAINGATLMIGYGLVALGCAAVLQGFCMIGSSYVPRHIANLGKISYGLYVYHVLIIELVIGILYLRRGVIYFAISAFLSLLVTILAAKFSYACFESPFLRLKRRFEVLHTRPI